MVKKTKNNFIGQGHILRGIKVSEGGIFIFGEAYFSVLVKDEIRAWKMHNQMTCNLLVPLGNIKFVIGSSHSDFEEIIIGETNYSRLTIPPGLWFGFQGLEIKIFLQIQPVLNIVLRESETKPLGFFLTTVGKQRFEYSKSSISQLEIDLLCNRGVEKEFFGI